MLVEPGILGFGIRKLAQGIRNPANDWNSESKFYRQGIRNPVPGIRNPQRGIQNSKWIANEAVIFQSNFQTFGNSFKWNRNFPGKFLEIPKLLNFRNTNHSTENSRHSGSKVEWKENFREKVFQNTGIPREVVRTQK